MKHQEYSSVLFSIWIKYIYYSIINVLVTYHYFSMNLIYGFFLIVKVSAIWVKPMGIGIEAITPVAQFLPFSKWNSGSVEVNAKIIMVIESPGQNRASLSSLNSFFLLKAFPHTSFSLVEEDLAYALSLSSLSCYIWNQKYDPKRLGILGCNTCVLSGIQMLCSSSYSPRQLIRLVKLNKNEPKCKLVWNTQLFAHCMNESERNRLLQYKQQTQLPATFQRAAHNHTAWAQKLWLNSERKPNEKQLYTLL